MLRTFWIRSARSRVKRCETDLRHALQWDHRHSSRDAHLQLREVGQRRFAAAEGRCSRRAMLSRDWLAVDGNRRVATLDVTPPGLPVS